VGLAGVISITSVIVYFVEPRYLDQFYQTSAIKQLIFFVPIILLLEAKNNIFSFWFSRTKNFKVPSIAKSIIGLSTALAQITIALSGLVSGLGLLIGYVFGQLASVGWYIAMFIRTKGFESPKKVSIQGVLEQARIHKKFPLFSSWNILLNTISRNLPPLLLVSYFSVAEAGFYAIGIRLLNMPLNTLGMSVGQVYYQQIARYKDQGIPMMPLLISTVGKLAGIIIIPLLIVFFTGEQLFAFVFGDSWSMAGRIAASMVPFYLMRFIASPLSTIFAVLGKQHLGLLWQLFYTLVTFGSFYYTRAYADFGFTIKTYSLAGAIAFMVLALVTIYATYQADKHTRLDPQK
jgi:O-antigen/teichoic acid export membrane protein